jgi:HTH-type transcriptional regulator, competence development regulator
MSYTSFGEFMRVLRVKNHEVMGDVAKMLGVKVPFLSAVENGKKNVPTEWIDKIVNYYNLNEEEQSDLKEAIEESKTQYKIIANDSGVNQRKAALQFARSFDEMDDETAIRIMELLNEREGSDKNGL